MPDAALVAEGTDQAAEILADEGVDLWLLFCRETGDAPEPCLPLVLGYDVVWPTVVAVTPGGRVVAILGRYDAPEAESMGVHEVRTYDESIAGPALDLLDEVDPGQIAVNYSADDATADGLSHGMYRRLRDLLDGTPYADRLVSAEEVVARLRGVKSPTEAARVRAAAATTLELFDGVAAAWRPDWTEADVADWLSARVEERGLGYAWSPAACPTVHAGADADVGHTAPGDRTLPPGEVLHVDFGVDQDGYAADVQRVFYRPRDERVGDGDPAANPPDDLREAFADVRGAVEAGRERLAPGVAGHEVDAVECGVPTAYGYVGLEEVVFVGEDGAEYVTEPQRELRVLDGA